MKRKESETEHYFNAWNLKKSKTEEKWTLVFISEKLL